MKYQKAWKVVINWYGKMLSSHQWGGANKVDYSKKGWIKPNPNCNPVLFVFKTREMARLYKIGMHDFKIIPVEVKNVTTSFKDIHGTIHNIDKFPKGTMFCSELRVIPKKKKIYAYKVVRKQKELLKSAMAGSDAIAYKIDRVTKPLAGFNQFLFVFETFEAANNFKDCCSHLNLHVYKCEITNPRKRVFDSDGNVRKVYLYPSGTLFCDSVKLIKEIS